MLSPLLYIYSCSMLSPLLYIHSYVVSPTLHPLLFIEWTCSILHSIPKAPSDVSQHSGCSLEKQETHHEASCCH
ncbi:hypothetical protein EB796_024768 [Bugula neritina]|uniref:Uncharacterized protein n=1 Tax=Bugula neritina TaxID=10212 RepID=A0A7J7IUL4_BUGNE|nr:hypothetical protein EB796_024768 [Bugula neritina]